MPRTKAFYPTAALDRAMELFWRDGYAGTGVDRLVRRTGASRYGLYTTFGGKRDLYLASLERYSQAVMDPMLEPLENTRASGREIRAFFDRVVGLIRRPGGHRGCFVCNAAVERGGVDAAAARRVRQHFDRVRRLLTRALANARRDGSLAKDLAVAPCADHLLGVAAGSFLLARSGMAIGFIRRFVDTALKGLT